MEVFPMGAAWFKRFWVSRIQIWKNLYRIFFRIASNGLVRIFEIIDLRRQRDMHGRLEFGKKF